MEEAWPEKGGAGEAATGDKGDERASGRGAARPTMTLRLRELTQHDRPLGLALTRRTMASRSAPPAVAVRRAR